MYLGATNAPAGVSAESTKSRVPTLSASKSDVAHPQVRGLLVSRKAFCEGSKWFIFWNATGTSFSPKWRHCCRELHAAGPPSPIAALPPLTSLASWPVAATAAVDPCIGMASVRCGAEGPSRPACRALGRRARAAVWRSLCRPGASRPARRTGAGPDLGSSQSPQAERKSRLNPFCGTHIVSRPARCLSPAPPLPRPARYLSLSRWRGSQSQLGSGRKWWRAKSSPTTAAPKSRSLISCQLRRFHMQAELFGLGRSSRWLARSARLWAHLRWHGETGPLTERDRARMGGQRVRTQHERVPGVYLALATLSAPA